MNTFAFTDAIATRNIGQAFLELEDLRARGVNPVFMIAVLGSHFGLMWRAKDASQKGTGQDSLGVPLSSSVCSEKGLRSIEKLDVSAIRESDSLAMQC